MLNEHWTRCNFTLLPREKRFLALCADTVSSCCEENKAKKNKPSNLIDIRHKLLSLVVENKSGQTQARHWFSNDAQLKLTRFTSSTY